MGGEIGELESRSYSEFIFFTIPLAQYPQNVGDGVEQYCTKNRRMMNKTRIGLGRFIRSFPENPEMYLLSFSPGDEYLYETLVRREKHCVLTSEMWHVHHGASPRKDNEYSNETEIQTESKW